MIKINLKNTWLKENGKIIFEIIDSGTGITNKDIVLIKRKINNFNAKENTNSGIGLININELNWHMVRILHINP